MFNTASILSESTITSSMIYPARQEDPEEIEENLWSESKDSILDQNNEEYVGEHAYTNYYKKFRQISKDNQRIPETPSVAYIKECSRVGISPTPLGLIKRKGQTSEINIKHYKIGNDRGSALGSSMKYLNPKAVILSDNSSANGVSHILCNLNDGLEQLDLSENNVNVRCLTTLCTWMSKKALTGRLRLRYLNISNNKLTDESLLVMCRGLKSGNPDLKELDLSKNMMGDFSAATLGEFMEQAHSLEVLNVSWNRITSFGGTKIFEGARLGRSARTINISYNLLGKSDSFVFVEAVQLAINEENLRHLDLSYNRMRQGVCEKLGMLIFDNHTLYGIHMEGNDCYVDKYGFIRVDKKSKCFDFTKNSINLPKNLNGYSSTMKFSNKYKNQYKPTANCWICEGWTENTFEVNLGSSFTVIEDPVHIHFDYNSYEPELMRCK